MDLIKKLELTGVTLGILGIMAGASVANKYYSKMEVIEQSPTYFAIQRINDLDIYIGGRWNTQGGKLRINPDEIGLTIYDAKQEREKLASPAIKKEVENYNWLQKKARASLGISWLSIFGLGGLGVNSLMRKKDK